MSLLNKVQRQASDNNDDETMTNGWPFFLTYDKTYTKVIPDISEDDVLQVLHDPPALTGLSPLVTKCVALDPSQPTLYTVHEDINVFNVFKAEIVCSVKFTRTSDGTDTQVKAGAWTTLAGKWRVKRNDAGEIEISETLRIRCIFLFMPFILSTTDGAHYALLERLAEKVRKL
ncbi:hypothetical protein BT96DRAFT_912406, partial [Gymnopus androsaceus JB14]